MKKLLALLCVASSACSVVDSTPQARQRAALLQPGWTEVGDYDARTQHAMAPLGATLVLFGGLTNTELGDTWVWDGTKWSRRTPAPRPSPATRTSWPRWEHASCCSAALPSRRAFAQTPGSGTAPRGCSALRPPALRRASVT
ncbi:MAG: hypothetical protein DI536_09050 [Archangium gephyra]|uniref:Uncharacterized protein n=1 Tax=Archangium gephyra TaxID=48 RepID=A0A2W5VWA4_9BACT|nr:MAG: hypothetical protein DI536_09050 [Archangium gephyra]